MHSFFHSVSNTHTHNHFTALLEYVRDHPGEQVPERQNQETNLDLLEQEIVSGSGIYWAICEVCTSSQTTMPTSHHSVFYRPDALPATQPTASKHWRQIKALSKRYARHICVFNSRCCHWNRCPWGSLHSFCAGISQSLITSLELPCHGDGPANSDLICQGKWQPISSRVNYGQNCAYYTCTWDFMVVRETDVQTYSHSHSTYYTGSIT